MVFDMLEGRDVFPVDTGILLLWWRPGGWVASESEQVEVGFAWSCNSQSALRLAKMLIYSTPV